LVFDREFRSTTDRCIASHPRLHPRFLALDHPWGAFLGFPGYLLLEPEWSSTDGSHFNPAGRLFDRAPKDERLKCAVSTVACAAFLLATFAACDGPARWATQARPIHWLPYDPVGDVNVDP
jgi:hypothetical protein